MISELEDAERMTVGNSVLTLQFCVNYGGRAEIADAAAAIAADVAAGRLRPGEVNEKLFARTWTCSSGHRGSSGRPTS